MEQIQTKDTIKERQRDNVDEPRRFKVVLHNDDFTTMEFVVMVLKIVFFKDDTEAEALMLKVHCDGQAVAGVYSYDIAASKQRKATNMAKHEGYPLKLTIQPAE